MRACSHTRSGKGGSGIEPLVKSLREHEGIIDYLERNDLADSETHAPMLEAAREFAELLPSKIRMSQ